MKANNYQDIFNAHQILRNEHTITYKEIIDVISLCDYKFGVENGAQIRKFLNYEFNKIGWADRVKISENNLTVSFVKDNVGICLQLGNIARIYADILKISYLGRKGIIDVGVIIVPDESEAKKLGGNYANFSRLSREIVLFSEIINFPILAMSICS